MRNLPSRMPKDYGVPRQGGARKIAGCRLKGIPAEKALRKARAALR